MDKASVFLLASVVSGSAWAEGETNLVSIEARAEIGTTKVSMPFEPRLDTRYEFERVTVLRRTKRAGVEGPFKPIKVKVTLLQFEDGFEVLSSDPALVWRTTAASNVVHTGALSLALGAAESRVVGACRRALKRVTKP